MGKAGQLNDARRDGIRAATVDGSRLEAFTASGVISASCRSLILSIQQPESPTMTRSSSSRSRALRIQPGNEFAPHPFLRKRSPHVNRSDESSIKTHRVTSSDPTGKKRLRTTGT